MTDKPEWTWAKHKAEQAEQKRANGLAAFIVIIVLGILAIGVFSHKNSCPPEATSTMECD